MPGPPIGGAGIGQVPATDALAQGLQPPGGAQGAETGQIEVLMGQVREIQQLVKAVGADFPTLAPDAEQISQILKRMVVSAASQAPQQTASGMAVPMGGGGGAQ